MFEKFAQAVAFSTEDRKKEPAPLSCLEPNKQPPVFTVIKGVVYILNKIDIITKNCL